MKYFARPAQTQCIRTSTGLGRNRSWGRAPRPHHAQELGHPGHFLPRCRGPRPGWTSCQGNCVLRCARVAMKVHKISFECIQTFPCLSLFSFFPLPFICLIVPLFPLFLLSHVPSASPTSLPRHIWLRVGRDPTLVLCCGWGLPFSVLLLVKASKVGAL